MDNELLKRRPKPEESEWEIENRELVKENQWHNYIHDQGKTKSGKDFNYYYIQKDYSVGVIALVDSKIVLVKQYRYLTCKDSLEIPGGGSNNDGTGPEAVAKRELLEETGYEAGNLKKIAEFDVSNGSSSDIAHLYLATGCKKVSEQDLEDTEEGMTVELFPVEEVFEMAQEGKISDAFTLAALLLAWPHIL